MKDVVDSDVTVYGNLRFKKHAANAVGKIQQSAALIMRCFVSRKPSLLSRAFVVYVGVHSFVLGPY